MVLTSSYASSGDTGNEIVVLGYAGIDSGVLGKSTANTPRNDTDEFISNDTTKVNVPPPSPSQIGENTPNFGREEWTTRVSLTRIFAT